MLPPVAILAGGLATRMRPLTETIPKALLDVDGTPFIVHQLNLLQEQGIERVVLCVGHLADMIRAALETLDFPHLHIAYSLDGPKLLGTAGALKRALPVLGETFFVLYGDSYLECDYRAIHAAFVASEKPALMTVYRNQNQGDTSNVIFRESRIVLYDKRHPTPDMQHIDFGLGLLHRDVFAGIAPDVVADLADVYSALGRQGRLAGYEVARRFYEIGSPAGLRETTRYLAGKRR